MEEYVINLKQDDQKISNTVSKMQALKPGCYNYLESKSIDRPLIYANTDQVKSSSSPLPKKMQLDVGVSPPATGGLKKLIKSSPSQVHLGYKSDLSPSQVQVWTYWTCTSLPETSAFYGTGLHL